MINFFVTGPGRSGSQMLLSALRQHSEIHCLGEIFLSECFEHTYIPDGKLTPGEILASLCLPSNKKSFGFSVLYNELFQSRYTEGLIDELRQRQFRVIHIVRDNLLRRFLSNEVANGAQVWTDANGSHPSTLSVTLSSRALFIDMKRTLDRAEQVRLVFRGLPFLELSYENLCGDFAGNLGRASEFLGVSYENLPPRTFQQEHRSLREAIANYERLKLIFAMSKYRRFFDD